MFLFCFLFLRRVKLGENSCDGLTEIKDFWECCEANPSDSNCSTKINECSSSGQSDFCDVKCYFNTSWEYCQDKISLNTCRYFGFDVLDIDDVWDCCNVLGEKDALCTLFIEYCLYPDGTTDDEYYEFWEGLIGDFDYDMNEQIFFELVCDKACPYQVPDYEWCDGGGGEDPDDGSCDPDHSVSFWRCCQENATQEKCITEYEKCHHPDGPHEQDHCDARCYFDPDDAYCNQNRTYHYCQFFEQNQDGSLNFTQFWHCCERATNDIFCSEFQKTCSDFSRLTDGDFDFHYPIFEEGKDIYMRDHCDPACAFPSKGFDWCPRNSCSLGTSTQLFWECCSQNSRDPTCVDQRIQCMDSESSDDPGSNLFCDTNCYFDPDWNHCSQVDKFDICQSFGLKELRIDPIWGCCNALNNRDQLCERFIEYCTYPDGITDEEYYEFWEELIGVFYYPWNEDIYFQTVCNKACKYNHPDYDVWCGEGEGEVDPDDGSCDPDHSVSFWRCCQENATLDICVDEYEKCHHPDGPHEQDHCDARCFFDPDDAYCNQNRTYHYCQFFERNQDESLNFTQFWTCCERAKNELFCGEFSITCGDIIKMNDDDFKQRFPHEERNKTMYLDDYCKPACSVNNKKHQWCSAFPETTPTTDSDSKSSSGLKKWQVSLIVIAVVLLSAGIALGAFFLLRSKYCRHDRYEEQK